MSFERIKSFILLALVLTSTYLTWQIWTYQPILEKTDEDKYFKVESDKQGIEDVVKPANTLFHVENQHFEINDEAEMNKIQTAFSKWSLYSFEDISNQVNEKEFLTFIHSKANTEINFSDQIPFKLYKSLFNVEISEVPEFTFDKIIFTSKKNDLGDVSIYFISTETQKVIQSKVNGEGIGKFYSTYYQHAEEYDEYVKFPVNKRKELYVLKRPTAMKQYRYQLEFRNISSFRDALFSDPTSVRQEFVSNGEEFTDGTRLLSVDRDSSMFLYINTSQKGKLFSSTSDLLQQSIDFVNDHAGWDKSYFRFSGLWQEEQRVVFRLYIHSLPVFNEAGMAEIEQTWGNEEIYQYQRPYSYLDFPYPEEAAKSIPSGEEAIKALKNIRNFNPEALEDLVIGYQMTKIASKVVKLEPNWYYRYGGTWIILPFEQRGGDL